MGAHRLLGALLVALLWVSWAGGLSAAGRAGERLEIRVEERTAEHSPEGGRWLIRYRFASPVAGVAFPRDARLSRAENWTAPPDARWTTIEGHDALVFDEARPTVELEVPADPTLGEDYLSTIEFSDGSRALYTGHLAVRAVLGDGEVDDAPRQVRWRLRTSQGRGIRVLEHSGVERLRWGQPGWMVPDNGTYLLFGNLEPIATERMLAIVDPGLPSWAQEMAHQLLPRLFEHYTEILASELTFRPLILLSSLSPETPNLKDGGWTTKGGTLDGVIQLALGGPGWATENDEQRMTLRTFLAHEAFHLWNGQLFTRRLGRADRWLSEGAATYFATRTLFDLGLIDRPTLQRRLIDTANRCLERYHGEPLAQEGLDDDLFYNCGATVQYIMERKVRRATRGARGAADVFALMFGKAAYSDGRYSRFDYLEAVQLAADDSLITGKLERIMHRGVGDSGAPGFFYRQLAATGVPVTLYPPVDEDEERDPKAERARRLRYRPNSNLAPLAATP